MASPIYFERKDTELQTSFSQQETGNMQQLETYRIKKQMDIDKDFLISEHKYELYKKMCFES